MSTEYKCFDSNLKQKKQYEKWQKLIKTLIEARKKRNEKRKNFEDYFPISNITKYGVNRLDYEPLLGA